MVFVFDTRTGNTRNFLKDLNVPAVKLDKDLLIDEPFVLVTYTTSISGKGNGVPPETTLKFLEKNHKNLMGVAASGDRNWGIDNFAKCADIISDLYKVKVLLKFEKRGTKKDRETFLERVARLND
ncbi:ribonucleotide reductase [Bacillus phage vB_BpuM-BpSp]|nr:ribonucleotide reductase [Bacillus phage vB_BpuM-BpSp]